MKSPGSFSDERPVQGKLQRALFLFFYLILFIVLAAGFFELLARTGVLRPSFKVLEHTIQFHPRMIYRIKPLSSPDINERGYRDTRFYPKKPGQKRVLFLGDSHVMASNLKSYETLPKILDRKLGSGYEVLNLGVVGYGPDQSLVQLMDEGVELEPDRVLLGLFPEDDFNDLVKNRLFNVTPEGELKWNPDHIAAIELPRSRGLVFLNYLMMKMGLGDGYPELMSFLFSDGYDHRLLTHPEGTDSSLKVTLMTAVLKAFDQEMKARGIEFHVVILTSYESIQNHEMFEALQIGPEKYFYTDTLAQKICQEEGISYILVYPELIRRRPEAPVFDPISHHFTAEGAEVVAQIIYDKLVEAE